MKNWKSIVLAAAVLTAGSVEAPQPYGALPSPAQMEWNARTLITLWGPEKVAEELYFKYF